MVERRKLRGVRSRRICVCLLLACVQVVLLVFRGECDEWVGRLCSL